MSPLWLSSSPSLKARRHKEIAITNVAPESAARSGNTRGNCTVGERRLQAAGHTPGAPCSELRRQTLAGSEVGVDVCRIWNADLLFETST